ncbi:MAG: cobalamin-binding protein [Myxococcales bacterium]|nr:cobalamin-binding protein [Myxococcales bacterium]
MLRVASLLPSLTEIVCALGCREGLVGRSHECDYPADVSALPALTAPKFDPEGSSLAIDQRVRALVRDGLSVYRVDPEGLKAARPDVILTQDQCEVCAAGIADVELAVASWLGAAPRVLSLAPRHIDDVWGDIERVAVGLDIPERGRALARQLREATAKLSERAAATDTRPRLVCIEWIEPLMAAGNWMPELVELAGGIPVFGESGELSPWITWEDVVAADPDALLVMPCGFDVKRTRAELPILEALPGYTALRAVREGRVFIADGNQYFNRSGPRLLESLQILAELLHPECFDFGHRDRNLLSA